MPVGTVTIHYTPERALIHIKSGAFEDSAEFGPTDFDNIAYYSRDKFKELDARRVKAENPIRDQEGEEVKPDRLVDRVKFLEAENERLQAELQAKIVADTDSLKPVEVPQTHEVIELPASPAAAVEVDLSEATPVEDITEPAHVVDAVLSESKDIPFEVVEVDGAKLEYREGDPMPVSGSMPIETPAPVEEPAPEGDPGQGDPGDEHAEALMEAEGAPPKVEGDPE